MNQIAQTILAQLGGPGRLTAMCGARDFINLGNGVQFKLRGRVSCVRITLDPSDTYTVEFYNGRGVRMRLSRSLSLVYADQLRELFTNQTGLYLSL